MVVALPVLLAVAVDSAAATRQVKRAVLQREPPRAGKRALPLVARPLRAVRPRRVLAAGSVVVKPVPNNVTVAGVPAKIVRVADTEEPALSMDQML